MSKIKIKNKEYEIIYCSLCKDIVIVCPKCDNASCNGGGCEFCDYAFRNSDEYLKAASIPGELWYRMKVDLNLRMNELYKERHGLYKKVRAFEKEKKT